MNENEKAPKSGKIKIFAVVLILIAAFATLILILPIEKKNREISQYGQSIYDLSLTDSRIRYMMDNPEDYPEHLLEMVRFNLKYDDYLKETIIDFCYNYPEHKDDYKKMQFSADELTSKEVTALYMTDKRWAYETLGGEYILQSGCMPVAITMAYINLKHNGEMDPPKIAKIAEQQGAITFGGGFSADYVKSLCESIGLSAVEYNFDESDGGEGKPSAALIKEIIDNGHVVLAGMVGDTFGGHAVIIRSCSEDGVLGINDPANPANTEKEWSFDELCPEIYYIWDLSV